MGTILVAIKTVNGNTDVKFKTDKPTNADYALALANLELVRKRLFEAFEKNILKGDSEGMRK